MFFSHAGSVEQGSRARGWAEIAAALSLFSRGCASLDGSILRLACSSGLRPRRKVREGMFPPSISHTGFPFFPGKRASFRLVAGGALAAAQDRLPEGSHPKAWLTDAGGAPPPTC